MTNGNQAFPALTLENVQARYDQLCAQRDETEKRIAPLREELRAASDKAEVARVAAMAVRARLDEARGPGWFALKREIGMLATMLGKLKPRAAPAAPKAAEGVN